ncbi:MAG: hypothetical protein H0X27_06650 [Caulobacteraceae bacterium]|nr:hypothetical protein [Caulobacteraceae bacterium]
MLKRDYSVKIPKRDAAEALRALLEEIPVIHDLDIELEPPGLGGRPDSVARFSIGDRPHILVGEVTSSGQPRHVRAALDQLGQQLDREYRGATAVLIAPYLSQDARKLCRDGGFGFLDLEGNCRIVFDGVFIERTAPTKPSVARRDLKSLFKPKSAQVLRVLLRDPHRPWKVAELSDVAGVSLGHVSNVRTALLNREWAVAGIDGLRLIAPDALLDQWRDRYEPPRGREQAYYTTLHGAAFDKAARAALRIQEGPKAILASYSAARWIAPFARMPTQFLYANAEGMPRLQAELRLEPAARGENVVIQLVDDGLFEDAIEPAAGVFTTGAAQTYLDLATSGERGEEAADHLRRQALTWSA